MILQLMPIIMPMDMGGEGLPPNKIIALLITLNLFIVLYWVIKSIIFLIKKGIIQSDYGRLTYFEYVFWSDGVSFANLFASLTFLFINGITIIIASAEFISTLIP